MGAAGNVGRKVTDQLLRQGEDVRVFEHDRKLEEFRERGAEVVRGTAINVEDLKRLFKDTTAALVLLPENLADTQFVANRSEMSRSIADALRETRVSHVVALSTVGVEQGNVAGPPAGLREYEERLFELEDVNVMVLRSTFYMDYLLANLPLIQPQKINGSAIEGDLKFPMIATQDVARGRVRVQRHRCLVANRSRRRPPQFVGTRGVGSPAPAQRGRVRELPLG